MTINYLKNLKFASFTVLLTILNISFNSITVEARSDVNSTKSASQVLFQSPVHLAQRIRVASRLDDDLSRKALQTKVPAGDRWSTLKSDSQQTIPFNQPTIVANSFGGKASWYGPGFHGRLTANGERYNQHAMTAAHPSLRFGTKVKVTNLNNGRSVVVRINDRGPYAGGRVIDLSAAAARSLNMISSGVAPVEVTILGR